MTPSPYIVAALYKFASLPDFEARQAPLLDMCLSNDIKGTILLASEGINGTIAGSRDGIDAVLDHIRSLPGCRDIEHKESQSDTPPFLRMKVRLKKEIVTMGVPEVDPTQTVGTYVDPADWNALIADPDVILIDTRNDYEVSIGTFKGAINPETQTFREFPSWFRAQDELAPDALKDKKVAMFCTGGIRCEKATAFAKANGLEDVYHLKGGILKYLENIPEDDSLWQGECFVFDERVAVKHGLEVGKYDLCRACRYPVDDEAKASPMYKPGVSCPNCFETRNEEQRDRYQERQMQMELADKKGRIHLGQSHTAKDT